MAPAISTRNYAIIVDAGSSGSRSQIYSWDNSIATEAHAPELPYVELGLGRAVAGDKPSGWKVEPGISTLDPSVNVLEVYLRQLLEPALNIIPPSARQNTPVYVLATAGMRLLNLDRQKAIVNAADAALERIVGYDTDAELKMRVITGEEEGFFGWLAVNYLMDGFVSKRKPGSQHTWGFLDMGGASTQIAFEPKRGWGDGIPREIDDGLIDFKLKMTDGNYRDYTVFVATWLGYGTNKARDRHVSHLLQLAESEANYKSYEKPAEDVSQDDDDDGLQIPDNSSSRLTIEDPCLPLNLDVVDPHTDNFIHGTGSFPGCLRALEPLLEREAFCAHPPCLFGGQRVPPIDFQLDRFVGVSEYWFSSEHVFGLGGAWDLVRFERAAEEYCSRDWNVLTEEWEAGNVSGVSGKWGDQIDLPRLRMQCFKASWIVQVLHSGIGIPRIVDPGGNITNTEDPSVKGKEMAEQKGLARPDDEPVFQSVNSVDSVPISWTLGSVLLTASGSQSPFVTYAPKDLPKYTKNSGKIFNFKMPSMLDDRLSSYAQWILVALSVILVVYVVYRIRRRRNARGRHDYSSLPAHLEEGTEAISLNDLNSPSARSRGQHALQNVNGWVRHLRSYFRGGARSRTPKLRHSGGPTGPISQPLQQTASSPAIMTVKSAPTSPKRTSPRLSTASRMSNDDAVTGLGLFRNTLALNRSSSNTNTPPRDEQQKHLQAEPPAGTPRASLSSRNNSSVNLTTLVSRTTSSAKLNHMTGFTKEYEDH